MCVNTLGGIEPGFQPTQLSCLALYVTFSICMFFFFFITMSVNWNDEIN